MGANVLALRDQLAGALQGKARPALTVVRAGGLGDTLLVAPTLQLIHDSLPELALTLLGSAWAERLQPMLDIPVRVINSDSPSMTPLFRKGAQLDPAGVFSQADAAVIYTSGASDPLLDAARRLCPGPVIGWPVRPSGAEPAAVHFARAVTAGEIRAGDLPCARLSLPASDEPEEGACPVAVHPGSGGARKRWPPERFARLIARLRRPVTLIEGPADTQQCREVSRRLPSGCRVTRAAGMPLLQVAALLQQALLYIGNDSGMSHMAAALGTPTVAIFGPTDPRVWMPHGPAVCAVPGAEGGWPTVDAVLETALRLLSELA